ncbi:MAG: rod shape-determining protein [Candidatus Berkelbacteria bacterium]|nr:rod shape-determining protein [Candidatus Berkelbacteria bacterium]
MSALFKKSKKHYAIALDIGTEYVKVLVYRVEGDTAFVVGTGKQKQGLSDMQGGRVTDIYGVIKNCDLALDQAFEEARVEPRQCVIGIAGELVKGATTTVHYKREKPEEKITVKELKDIIEQVQARAFEKIRSELIWETGQSEVDVKLVNSAVVDVRIDGYKITNPVGLQGRDVQVGIFNAFAPIVHMGALQTIAEELKLDLLSIAAEPYAVARSVGLEDSAEFSSIFIDIGGGTTDIAVVRSGGLEGTKMFGIGGRVFTKTIADALDKTFTEAEKLKIDYSNGKIPKESPIYKSIRSALENNCEVWLAGVELALEEFSNVELLPSKILLCGGGSLLPEIKEYLHTTSWTTNLPFAKPPKVDFIKPAEVMSVKDETGKLKGAQDITPMSLANLGIDLAGDEKVVDGLVERIISGLRS